MNRFTYLLRLAGPMQSWGVQSRFSIRDTGMEPSKSGVIGLIAAALGRDRSESIDDLAALRFGVRIDRPGVVKVDYQTAGGSHKVDEKYGVIKAAGKGLETSISRRYYLADAVFTAGLEGDKTLLHKIHESLLAPVYPIFLGRLSYVPSPPPVILTRPANLPGPERPAGLTPLSLEEALARAPFWIRSTREKQRLDQEMKNESVRLRISLEMAPDLAAETRSDFPLDLDQRKFAYRGSSDFFVPLEPEMIQESL